MEYSLCVVGANTVDVATASERSECRRVKGRRCDFSETGFSSVDQSNILKFLND